KDGELFLMGGPFGSSIVSKGSVSDVLLLLEDLKADLNLSASSDMLTLFSLAAAQFPDIFSGASEIRTSADGYLYRHYADTGVYAGIKNGLVYLKGGAFGSFYTS